MIGYEVQDNLTNYFDELESYIKNKSFKEKVLHDSAKEMVEIADDIVPKWNPNLMYSGLNEAFWNYTHDKSKSIVEVIYTGFTDEGMGEPEDIQVFWQFGKYHKGGYSDILGRDYAYYIEYGKDRYAPNEKYKAPDRQPSLFLTSALMDMEELIEYHAEDYLTELLGSKHLQAG